MATSVKFKVCSRTALSMASCTCAMCIYSGEKSAEKIPTCRPSTVLPLPEFTASFSYIVLRGWAELLPVGSHLASFTVAVSNTLSNLVANRKSWTFAKSAGESPTYGWGKLKFRLWKRCLEHQSEMFSEKVWTRNSWGWRMLHLGQTLLARTATCSEIRSWELAVVSNTEWGLGHTVPLETRRIFIDLIRIHNLIWVL